MIWDNFIEETPADLAKFYAGQNARTTKALGVLSYRVSDICSESIEAVGALSERKYGQGGVFNEGTPGAWKDSSKIRKSAHEASQEFKDCVALQAQYIYDTYGKFPATTPSIFAFMYLQAHHLDLGFYDYHFKPGAYLSTHSEHKKIGISKPASR